MAFPTPAARTESKLTTAGTSFTINFTQTTGDLVLIFVAFDTGATRTLTVGDSFTDLTARNGVFHIIYKVLDGSEGGNVVVSWTTNAKSCAIAYNIGTGTFDSAQAPEHSTIATGVEGSGGTPDSGNLAPSWGSDDNLWITAFQQDGEEADDDTWVTGTPANYTNLIQVTTETTGASTANGQCASMERELAAASENPGNFTCAQDRGWEAYTVAIKPVAAGGGSQTLVVDAGSYSVTGQSATLRAARKTTPDSGSYAVSGTAASLEKGYKITAEAGTYTITGISAGLTRTALITSDSGVYTLSGTDAGLAKGRTIAADPGSYAITGQDATLKADRKITPDSGSYSITGTAAGLNKGQRLSVDAGSYAIQGSDATLTVTRKITPDSGIYSISGTAASLLNARKIIADSGTYTITGITSNLTSTRKITIVSGVYSISGSIAALEASRLISIAPGSYAITGQDATLTLTAAQNKTLVADPGSYSITGQDVQFVAPRRGGGRARKQDLKYLREQWAIVYGDDEDFVILND